MTKYLWDCLYCGFPTKDQSRTCPAHRDLAPPILGLDEPYPEQGALFDADGLEGVPSPGDPSENPGRGSARSERARRREEGLGEDS